MEPTPTSPPLQIEQSTLLPTTNPISIPNEPLNGEVIPVPPVSYAPFGTAEKVEAIIPAVIQLVEPAAKKLAGTYTEGEFTEAEFNQLAQDGYLVRRDQTMSVSELYSQSGPLIVTADIVLLATLATQQEAIRSTEAAFGERAIFDMLTGLIDQSQQQFDGANDQLTQAAAIQNLAIFTLAGKFYDRNWPVGPDVAHIVETEFALAQNNGEFDSPLLNRLIQYTPIVVEPAPSARATSWLSVSSPRFEPNQTPAEQRLTGKQIELLLDIWQSESVPAWQQTMRSWNYLYGGGQPTIDDWLALENVSQNDDFVQSAINFPTPRFDVIPNVAKSQLIHIMEQLLFNRVGVHADPDNAPASSARATAGTIRVKSRMIDVAAAFGSQIAVDTLVVDGEAGYAGWEAQVAQLQVGLIEQGGWPATHQQDFLRAIQPLAEPVSSSYPAAMRTANWDSLTQWENATIAILSTAKLDREPIQIDFNTRSLQLEIRPDIYANLATQTRILADGLARHQRLDQENAEQLLQLEQDLLMLKAIAEKQMMGRLPSDEEEVLLAKIISTASKVDLKPGASAYLDPTGALLREVVGVAPAVFYVQAGNNSGTAIGGRLQTASIEN